MDRRAVEVGEGVVAGVGVVEEVEHEDVALLRVRAVEAALAVDYDRDDGGQS